MYRRTFLFVLLVISLGCSNREEEDDQLFCTLEFKTITVKVIGAELTEYYTIRQATNDTIVFSEDWLRFENYYPILTDSLNPYLIDNEPEIFQFVGFTGDAKVVEENYLIGSDQCHIVLEAGDTEIVVE